MAIKISAKLITADGKRCGVTFGLGPYLTLPADTITIYPRNAFPAEVRKYFEIENNSDSMTDYFEAGRIRVFPAHPLYEAVKAAATAGK